MATLTIKNLPDPLYDALKARAKSQHRSVAQEVTHLLADALRRQEPRSILELRGLGKNSGPGSMPPTMATTSAPRGTD